MKFLLCVAVVSVAMMYLCFDYVVGTVSAQEQMGSVFGSLHERGNTTGNTTDTPDRTLNTKHPNDACSNFTAFENNSTLPEPIIFQFWETLPGKIRPGFVDAMTDSVKAHLGHPSMKVVVLNTSSPLLNDPALDLHENWTNIEPLQMKADYLRYKLIYTFGGIWFDTDTVGLGNIYEDFFLYLCNYDFLVVLTANDTRATVSAFGARAGASCLHDSYQEFEKKLSKGQTKFRWAMYKFEYEDIVRCCHPKVVEDVFPLPFPLSDKYLKKAGSNDSWREVLRPGKKQPFIICTAAHASGAAKQLSYDDVVHGDLMVSGMLQYSLNV